MSVSARRVCHLAVIVCIEDEPVTYRVVDVGGADYQPLLKELAFRSVANYPARRGQAWQLHLEMSKPSNARATIELFALGEDDGRTLARLSVPVDHFAWFGTELARQADLERKDYTVQVALLNPDHTWLAAPDVGTDDFEVVASAERPLLLPTDFSTQRLGRRAVVRPVASWMRCVFHPSAWREFLQAARDETEKERGWAAVGRVHLADDHLDLFILDGSLFEMPAEADRHHLLTRGSDFHALHRRVGPLAAYLHLHPPDVDGVPLGPFPSGPDSTVAWNFDACTPLPIVLPIAMFGADPRFDQARFDQPSDEPREDVAAHGFSQGLLSEIQLEVIL